jgi:two-component system, response regulator PdtaR
MVSMRPARRYLIVDDNRAFAENLAEILGDGGDDATIATTPSEALALLRSRHGDYDALVTDMRLPEMSGAELVRRARELDPGLPAIVVSAYASSLQAAIVHQAGLVGILPKPVPIVALLGVLAKARRSGVVVVVECDTGISSSLVQALAGRGFAPVTAQTFVEAEHLGELGPFVMLVDLVLPGSLAAEVLGSSAVRFPHLPVIAFSHKGSGSMLSHGVMKSYDLAALLDNVERVYSAAACGRRVPPASHCPE